MNVHANVPEQWEWMKPNPGKEIVLVFGMQEHRVCMMELIIHSSTSFQPSFSILFINLYLYN